MLVLINRWRCAVTELSPFPRSELVDLEQVERDGSAPKLFVTTWRKTSRATQQSVLVPFAGAHHPEHGELFMPALTLEPRSGLHCHADPHSAREAAEAGKRLNPHSYICI